MIKKLNLNNGAAYKASTDWLRTNVILRNNVNQPVLQLDLGFSTAQVTVFMEPKSHYILAFQGATGIFLLDDAQSAQFGQDLKVHLKGANVTLLKGFKAHHDQKGLETFAGTGPNRNRIFDPSDLYLLPKVSHYVAGAPYSELRRALSLLVCMVAEAARFMIIQYEFGRMLEGRVLRVPADEIVQDYRKAKVLRSLAFRAFPGSRVPDAVTKMDNRAKELEELIKRFTSQSPGFEAQTGLRAILQGGQTPPGVVLSAGDVQRFQAMCKELSLSTANDVTSLITMCADAVVVRAAQDAAAIAIVDG